MNLKIQMVEHIASTPFSTVLYPTIYVELVQNCLNNRPSPRASEPALRLDGLAYFFYYVKKYISHTTPLALDNSSSDNFSHSFFKKFVIL